MERVPCCWLERSPYARVSLRAYTFATRSPCMAVEGGHDVTVDIGRVPVELEPDGSHQAPTLSAYLDDPRWPTRCTHCDQLFPARHEWEVLSARLYQVTRTLSGGCPVGTETLLADAPVGAMWRPVVDRHARMTIRVATLGDLKRDLTLTGRGWSIHGDPPSITIAQMLILDQQRGAWIRGGYLDVVAR